MKKFVFKLETVLDMRKRKEEEVQIKLGIAISDLHKMQMNLEETRRKKGTYQSEIEIFKTNIQQMDDLLMYQNYVDSVEQLIERMKLEIREMEKKVEEIRILLGQAARERKMIEKMKEREYEKYQKEQRLQEINFLDEIGVLKEARRIMSKSGS